MSEGRVWQMMKVTPTEEVMMQGTDATSSTEQERQEIYSVFRT